MTTRLIKLISKICLLIAVIQTVHGIQAFFYSYCKNIIIISSKDSLKITFSRKMWLFQSLQNFTQCYACLIQINLN